MPKEAKWLNTFLVGCTVLMIIVGSLLFVWWQSTQDPIRFPIVEPNAHTAEVYPTSEFVVEMNTETIP